METNGSTVPVRFRRTVGDRARLRRLTNSRIQRAGLGVIAFVYFWFPLMVMCGVVGFVTWKLQHSLLRPAARASIMRNLWSHMLPVLWWPVIGSVVLAAPALELRSKKPIEEFDRTVELTASGVRNVSPHGEATLPWRQVHSVAPKSDGVYLLGSRGDGLLVPQRAFASPTDEETFVLFATSHAGVVHTSDNLNDASITYILNVKTVLNGSTIRATTIAPVPHPRARKLLTWAVVLPLFVSGLLPVGGDSVGNIVLHIAGIALSITIGIVIERGYIPNRPKVGKPLIHEIHNVTLNREGVTTATPLGSTNLSWRNVEKITTETAVIGFLSRTADSVIVPRNAFTSPEAEERFLEIARAYQRGETPPPAPVIWPPVPAG